MEQDYIDELTFTNNLTTPTILDVVLRPSTKYILKCPTEHVVVDPGKSHTLSFTLFLNCTTTVDVIATLVLNGNKNFELHAKVSAAPSYMLDWDEIKLGDMLGQGVSAVVYKALWKQVTVAVKIFRMAELDVGIKRDFIREIRLLMNIHHPNIITLVSAVI